MNVRLIDADALKERIRKALGIKSFDNLLPSEKTIVKQIDMASTIHPEPHWIPVTEDTLPEEGRIVVVYGEKGTWDYGKYRGYGPNIHYWYWKNKTFKKVYWWMYKEDALPESYKGVTE